MRGVLVAGITTIAIAGVAMLATVDEGGSAPQDDAWTAVEFFGVNAPLLRDYARPGREAALDALSGSMGAAGIRRARIVFDQAVEQRLPGAANWGIPDRIVASLARHGVRTEALFIGTPVWAASPTALPLCGKRSFPANVSAWAGFVGAAVERYGRGGEFWAEHPELEALPIETWEIGNEPNLQMFWCPAANPEQYAAVYEASRATALKADSGARVIVGGLAPTFEGVGRGDLAVPEFLRRLTAAAPDLADQLPAVAIHPYAPTAELTLLTVRRYREAMRAAGLGETPMLVNEVGWYTNGPNGAQLASDEERARQLRELALASGQTDCGLAGFGVHAWITAERFPWESEHWYGLAHPWTGRPNESGRAYAAAIAEVGSGAAEGSGQLGSLCN